MLTRLRCFRRPHWVRGLWGGVVSVGQDWGLIPWWCGSPGFFRLLRQVSFLCIMSVVVCPPVPVAGRLRMTHT